MARWFFYLVLAVSNTALGFPSFFGQIVSTQKHKSIAVYRQGDNTYEFKIGDRFFQYLISDIRYRYIYLTDNYGTEFSVMIGSPIFDENTKTETKTKRIKGFEKHENEIYISKHLRDKIANDDIFTILMQAASEPYYEWEYDDYSQLGFRLFSIEPGSIYDMAGIEDGDVITHINYKPLDSTTAAVSILRGISYDSHIVYTYLRGGISSDVSINIGH